MLKKNENPNICGTGVKRLNWKFGRQYALANTCCNINCLFSHSSVDWTYLCIKHSNGLHLITWKLNVNLLLLKSSSFVMFVSWLFKYLKITPWHQSCFYCFFHVYFQYILPCKFLQHLRDKSSDTNRFFTVFSCVFSLYISFYFLQHVRD